MPSASSAKPFKSLKAAMRRRPRAGSLLSVIFPGPDCISRSRRAPAGREAFLAPSLQARPYLGKGPEFCATANEDGDLALHRVGIVGGLAHVFDVLEFAFQDFPGIVKNDQTISRIAPRAPQKISLMATAGGWQSVAAAKEIDGARVPVGVRENTAPPPFFGRQTAASLICSGDDLRR